MNRKDGSPRTMQVIAFSAQINGICPSQKCRCSNQQKEISQIVDLTVLAEHSRFESNLGKYLNFARELNKLTVVLAVISAGNGLKECKKRVGGSGNQGKASNLKTARIVRRVCEYWGRLLALDLQCKPSVSINQKAQ